MSKQVGRISTGLLGAALWITASVRTDAQTSDPMEDMKRLCVGDYFRLCGGTDPYGDDVRQCFDRNRRQLSAGCRNAIDAYHRRGDGE